MRVKVVNEQGEDIGAIERQYVVPLGLWHQVVRLIITCHATGRIALQQRSFKKDSCPGMWDTSASGHVDAGEEPLGALLRETKEEIGLDLKGEQSNISLRETISTEEKLAGGWLRRLTLVYAYQAPSEDIAFAVDPSELERIAWFGREEVAEMLAGSSTREPLTPGAAQAMRGILAE